MAGGIHEDITLPHEEAWELYHNCFSLFSKKTRVCLSELGIKYKSHHIELISSGKYENVSRDYLKVNPAAVVPVLVHHGHPVYESHEQLFYASAHSDQPDLLVPEDEEKRELMKHWVSQSSMVNEDPIKAMKEGPGNSFVGLSIPFFAVMAKFVKTRDILVGLLFHLDKKRPLFLLIMKMLGAQRALSLKYIARIVEKSRNAMHVQLDRFEATLSQSSGPWIIGDQFTLADVGMLTILDHLNDVDVLDVFLDDSRPNIQSYWRALQQRPSYKDAIEEFSHPKIVRTRERLKELKNSDANFRETAIGKKNNKQ